MEQRRIGRRMVACLLGLLVLTTVACKAPAERSPYVVTVDVTSWIEALGSDDLFESEPAADGLTALGPAVIPALEAAYGREEPAIRRGVIEVLQKIDAPGCDFLLLRAAQDPDVNVRTQAILGLGRSHDERARPVVEAALEDPEPAIRDAAVDACATVCLTPSALRRLVDIAIHEPPLLRIMRPRQTLRSLIGAEDERQATAAREAIEAAARPLLREDSGAEERVRAAFLIADLEDPAATPWLVDVLEHGLPGADERLRLLIQAQTIQTLGAAGDATCIDVLGRMSRRPTDPLKEAACQALQRLAQRGVEGAVAESRRCTAGNG